MHHPETIPCPAPTTDPPPPPVVWPEEAATDPEFDVDLLAEMGDDD